nr:DMT family transporter [Caballeronia zhejiangensis]
MSSQSLTDISPGVVVKDHAARTITLRSFGALLILAVMWGLSIPVTKLGLESLPPLTLTAMRFAIAVPLLLIFAVGRHPLPRHALPRVAMLGVLGIGIGQVAQTFGVSGTSASVGTTISATIPVFIVSGSRGPFSTAD